MKSYPSFSDVEQSTEIPLEWQLLLRCCRLETPNRTQIESILRHKFDWTLFEWLTIAHQVRPLVYFHLIHHQELVPKLQFERFQRFYQANLLQSQVQRQRILAILDHCTTAQIQVIPFKGLSLAIQAYQAQSLREFCDFDIFCRKSDVLDLVHYLCDQGYEVKHGVTPTNAVNQAHADLFIDAECEYSLGNPDAGISLEPHWDIAPRRFCTPFDQEQLWHNLGSVSIAQTCIPCFAVEDLLIVLCLNGNKDYWKSLKNICDIAALLTSHPEIRWPDAIQTAQRLGLYRIMLVGVVLAETLIGCPLPDSMRQRMERDFTLHRLTQHAQQKLIQNLGPLTEEPFYTQVWWNLSVRERWRDRIRYLWVNIFVPGPAEAKLFYLPKSLRIGYFLVRPFRLLWKAVKGD